MSWVAQLFFQLFMFMFVLINFFWVTRSSRPVVYRWCAVGVLGGRTDFVIVYLYVSVRVFFLGDKKRTSS